MRTVQSQVPHLGSPQISSLRNDHQREKQPHTKDSDDHTHRQKQPLPELIPVFEDGSIDDRIIKGQRDFHDAEDERHPERGHGACHTPVFETPPRGQRQADDCDEDGTTKVPQYKPPKCVFSSLNQGCLIHGNERIPNWEASGLCLTQISPDRGS